MIIDQMDYYWMSGTQTIGSKMVFIDGYAEDRWDTITIGKTAIPPAPQALFKGGSPLAGWVKKGLEVPFIFDGSKMPTPLSDADEKTMRVPTQQ